MDSEIEAPVEEICRIFIESIEEVHCLIEG